MSYQALYRKFRPQTFEDVKGQDHIVTTLKNQIKANRTGHAYLFCGTRGTGKTSVAKIFAKALNCENLQDGSPCDECAMCKAITAGNSMNVIEIDAASNNGVDNIREIRENVAYSPAEGKYKVYIIDEVHMLSAGAFNALLKTLEEPPSYVKFILATTEVHKIPVTILSRCQRYDFHRISIDTIAGRLQELMVKENQEAEEKALRYVAKAGDGSMRDALSLLDQCLAFHMNEKLTYDMVLEVLGAVDTEIFSSFLQSVLDQNVAACIKQVENLIIEGREMNQFVNDFCWYLRNLLLLKSSDDMEDLLDISSENLALLKKQSEAVDAEILMRYIRVFSDLSNQIKYSAQKRILIEIALIKLCKPAMETSYDALVNRVALLEQQLEQGVVVQQVKTTGAAPTGQTAAPIKEEPKIRPEAVPEEIRMVKNQWKSIKLSFDGLLKAYLSQAEAYYEQGNQLILAFKDVMGYEYCNAAETKESIRQSICERIGREIQLKMVYNDEHSDALRDSEKLEDIFGVDGLVRMDVEIED